ncbi:MAG: porin family protein [Bacteroidetes bacterium]|nr:porin family protein [Bacteroidota bacterium]
MKTKNLLWTLLTSLLVMFSTTSIGQGFGLGVRVGSNFSKLTNWDKYVSDFAPEDINVLNPFKVGIQAGLVINPMFSKYIGMEIEINYEQKGMGIKFDGENDAGHSVVIKGKYNLNYLTLPIMLKAGFASKIFRIHAIVGPYVGYAVNGTLKTYEDNVLKKTYDIEFGSGEKSDNQNTIGGPKGIGDPEEDQGFVKANSLDVGFVVGIQPGVKLGPGDLVLDIRYSRGFIGIDNPTSDQKKLFEDALDKPYYDQCNSTLGVSISYIFRLGHHDKD